MSTSRESSCVVGLHSWWRDHFTCSEGDPTYPSFEQFTFWPDQCETTRWGMYLCSLQDNELCWPIGLDPRKVLMVWAWCSAIWPSRRLSRCSSRHLWRFFIQLATIVGRWGTIQASWWAVLDCGTWLWWPCCSRRETIRRGVRVWACRWHKDWQGYGRSNHPAPPKPVWHDQMTWPSGRTLQTFEPEGMLRLFGPGRMGNLESLAWKGGHWSKWDWRLWPRQGKPRLLVLLSKVPGYSVNKKG